MYSVVALQMHRYIGSASHVTWLHVLLRNLMTEMALGKAFYWDKYEEAVRPAYRTL